MRTGMEEIQAKELAAIETIKKLKHLYWRYNDVGLLGDKIAALFTEDGVWSNKELGHYEGRDAIRDFFNATPPTLPFCAHVGMNPIIDIDGNSAAANWRALLYGTFVENQKESSRLILIDYNDQFECIEGRWFIKKLDILFNFDVEFGKGWSGEAIIRELSA